MRTRTDTIARLMGEARDLWREALTADELDARFEAMRQQIPALDERPTGWWKL